MKADHEADDMTERNQLGRRLANSLCKAVLNPKCWKCPCRAKHQVCLHLADIARSLSAIEFQVVFKTTMSDDDHCGHTRWQRMEVKSGVPDSLKPGESSGGLSDQANGQTTPVTMPCLCLDKHHIGRSMEILNMCDTLAQYSHADGRRTFLGCLREEDIHHPLFIIHCTDGILQSYSLEQLLLLSEPRYSATAGSSHFFSRRDRLYLAPTLACAVLQLHENWLPALWGSQDIHFYKHGRDLQEAIKSPFLTRRVTEPNPVRTNTASAVRNAVLFPLGLALVELSLCSNIASLKTSEDQSPDEITTMFLTANRCMDRVYLESGKRYGDVVQHCLFWSQPGDGDLESAEFRSAVFGRIIRPLIDDVEAFTGTIWPLTGHDISRTS